ncbi:hypothetical protein ABVB18_21945 [Xanthomonas citri pv. mangiferaeindicae]|uniref:Uncharacterized protein n=1 Tax=Xanthomonas axonopodis pv. clitoriae TaxID=487828 RepID=A0AB73N9Z3_9XANT|nr:MULTISPECIES: hypothetical protein [Xanthomonas]OOW60962.1 hypothetical protein Xcnt_18790 [Xanthomonas campestris pv. centellae]OOW77834.1 hypothetical protein Xclt_19460 [Xanthomonas axonopodis pv. clitoriae]UDB90309.1 hypothetical protein LCZ91_10770 [Xanthomonas citri pv. mangiferaeindicae]UDI81983.1 hypothetical protein XCM_13335 [Xanthomonas citri pv. mangiferaeindicae]
MDIPKAVLLLTEHGERVGVLLLAPDDLGACGSCVFMLMPSNSSCIDSDMGIVVSELKVAGEHRFQVMETPSGIELIVVPIDLYQIELKLDSNFSGRVLTDLGGVNKCIGAAEPLPGSA